jgi:hypothetical protein
MWWASSLVFAVYLFAQSAHSQTVPGGAQLNIDDPRPVAKAAEELVARYGYVITYEDPPFSYEGDLRDVTTQVRRDLDRYSPGKAPKVLVPRGGTLTVSLPSSASGVSTQTMASALGQLVRAHSSRDQGGRFRVVQVGDIFHIVPYEIKDRNGNWIAQNSILDSPISLPIEDRTEVGMLDAVVTAVSSVAHAKIHISGGFGMGIENPDRPASYRLGANNEPARDVLMRALVLLNDPKAGTWRPQRQRWQLLYDSDASSYFLDISPVPDLPSAPLPSGAQETSTGTALGGTNSSSGTSSGTSVPPKQKQ